MTMKKLLLSMLIGLPLIFQSLGAQAEITPQEIDQLAAAQQEQVVQWRRWFHANPELSNREVKTAAYIAEQLRAMGLEPKTGIAHHGIVALIEGGLPGPMVAIRSDMDGLPVTEETGLPFASQVKGEYNGQEVGVMHACGHDAHMAMLLGAAAVLNKMKAELPGSVMLIFQPAEEGPPNGEKGGASLMLEEGIFEPRKPEAVFGIHVGINQPANSISVKPGPMMAAADRFLITVKGKQTHGAQPWGGVDPIVVSAQIILGLQTIASRQVNVTLAPSIISVGRIQGGVRNNVIPDSVEFEGTIRTFDQAMREQIHASIERTAKGIAESAGAVATVVINLGSPAVVNDPELVARMMPTLERVTTVNSLTPQTVAEDFSEFALQTPAIFMFLGNGAPGVDAASLPSNHSPMFDMYEPSMETGVRVFSNLVVDCLKAQ
ncbi:MAG: amidohydrolase [Xanthomonadales bacterium]|nr:amidohydrolase [Xanthomonadales bacterium]